MKNTRLFNNIKGGLIQKTVMMLVVMLCTCLSITKLNAQNVATIGGAGYATLQAAVTAAQGMTGDITITLASNTSEQVSFRQQPNLNLTIDGDGKTLSGQIIIHGDSRFTGTDVLNITNLNFEYESSYNSPAGFVCVNGSNNNAHNVTVSYCTFDGGGPNNGMAAYRGPNGAPAFNVVLDHLIAKNAHSLAQVNGTTGLSITNCKAVDNVKNGISISGGKGTYTIENDTLTCNSDGEYAFRYQNQSEPTTANISGNVFNGPKAIITKNNTNTAVALNLSSGWYEGALSSEGTDNTVYSFTGGTFTEPKATVDGYCAPNYTAIADDPSAGYCTVRMPEVARIGTTIYPSLQAAVDYAYDNLTGDVTIELLDNTSEIVIICQKPNLQLTIDGQDDTLTGQIIVNYGSNTSDNTATLTITDLNFVYDDNYYNTTAGKYFIAVPNNPSSAPWHSCDPSYTGTYNDAHNITVSNCTFDGDGSLNGAAAFYVSSGTNNVRNLTLDHLTVTNAHSLVQIQGGVNGLTITNCKAVDNVKNGINISGGTGTIIITNDTITTLTGGDQYGLRLRGSSNGNRDANLTDNQFIAPRAFEMNNSTTGTTLYITSGRYEGEIYRTGADVSNFSFTGGTFTEPKATVDGYCAPTYIAIADDPSAGYCTVREDRPVLFMDSTDVVCFGENNGTDTVRIQGGTPPFQLVLSSSVLTKNDTVNLTGRIHIYTDLKPGSYTVTVTQAGGTDEVTGTFTINEPPLLEITAFDVPQRPCPLMGSGNYDVSVTAVGGNTGAYTYTWGDAAVDVNADATTVVSGNDDRDSTYTVSVTVTDVKNCSATATETFTVSAVIANDGTVHSNSTLTIDTIRQGIETGCDTIIRDFGTPVFSTTIAGGYPEDRLVIVNNIPTQYPDSVFAVGESKIIWTATDTCGHSITGEQVIIIYHYPCPDMTDQDGNVYTAVRIGCDCWTTENLKTTTDNHGSTIDNLMSYQSPMHPDAAANAAIYGYLYDWNTALDAASGVTVDANGNVQGICPTGWHLPNQDNYMSIAGANTTTDMKDLRYNNYWLDGGGNNSTGFALLPGGFYNDNTGRYEDLLGAAYLWSVNSVNVNEPKVFWADCHCYMWHVNDATINSGCSIRCIKD